MKSAVSPYKLLVFFQNLSPFLERETHTHSLIERQGQTERYSDSQSDGHLHRQRDRVIVR